MPVAAIAEMYLEMGQSLEEIAVKYDLSFFNSSRTAGGI
jgi:hypothetical protein